MSTDLTSLEEDFERACSVAEIKPDQSVTLYQKILLREDLRGEDANVLKEKAIYALAEIYIRDRNGVALKELLISSRPFFEIISKAKAGKIVRTLIDRVQSIPNAVDLQIELCQDCLAWCEKEERTFLKLQIQAKLAQYYLEAKKYVLSLKLITLLIREVKKIDDKQLLVESHLIESRIQHALGNIAKSKAALTASRAAANSIYIGPLLQSEIDMQAGTLSSEEKDYKTSYSYFYEAFEGFDSLKDLRAPLALKYMILSKIMNNQPQDVNAILSNKLALKYNNKSIEAMKEIAKAYKERSLDLFENVLKLYSNEINEDIVITNKIDELTNKLLEQNLQRLLEPFSKVEITHIAKLINLPIDRVQHKLSQMILDKKFNGILDQGAGAIIVFDDEPEDKSYRHANESIEVLNDVVDKLFDKAKELD